MTEDRMIVKKVRRSTINFHKYRCTISRLIRTVQVRSGLQARDNVGIMSGKILPQLTSSNNPCCLAAGKILKK